MAENIAWQIFKQNGSPDIGTTILPGDARGTTANVGAVHIWAWSRTENGVGVWLQKRAQSKATWPGKLDISFAGHIDSGESVFDAAKRESLEEVGCDIDVEALLYAFSYRNAANGTKWIYLYELPFDTTFVFADGEVESMRWVPLKQFEKMCEDPEANGMVPRTREYFAFLMKSLEEFTPVSVANS